MRARGRVAAVAAVLLDCLVAAAARLPITVYTGADGLGDESVLALLQDRTGFLWVGTSAGLARFDGSTFHTYGEREGLPSGVWRLLEDHDGTLWLISAGEVLRLRPLPGDDGRLFQSCAVTHVDPHEALFDLLEDHRGELWLTGGQSLYRYVRDVDRFEPVPLDVPWPEDGFRYLVGLAEGADGSLWIRASFGLVRRLPDGRITAFPLAGSGTIEHNNANLVIDGSGRLWLTGDGIVAFVPPSAAAGDGLELSDHLRHVAGWNPASAPDEPGEALEMRDDGLLPAERIHTLLAARDGTFWVGGDALVWAAGGRTGRLDRHAGLPGHTVLSLIEDDDGNLWVGTEGGGLARIDRSGFTSWGVDDGLATVKLASVIPDHHGGVLVVGFPACRWVHRLDGDRFTAFALPVPDTVASCGWGEQQVTLVDRSGEWWVPTTQGLLRFPAVARLEDLPATRPAAWYTAADGLGDDRMFRLFEDSRGDIWAGVFGVTVRLVRFDRAEARFVPYGPADGLPLNTASAFAEAPDGSLWIGFYGGGVDGGGGVARYRDGSFRYFPPAADGPPPGFVSSLLVDSRHRLWVATAGDGVAQLENPDREPAAWTRLGTRDGLASDAVLALAEDHFGRIYVGTRVGLDRLDPATGRLRHFDTASGLASNGVVAMTTDAAGDVWVATTDGVSRLHPLAEAAPVAPATMLTELRAAGHELSVPERGARELGGLAFPPSVQNLEVAFTAVDLHPGAGTRFQSRLDDNGWSSLSDGRRVHLAGLAAGSYRFEVRAVLADGTPGTPARLAFAIAPPLWRRWWFQGATILAVAAAAFGAHRRRLRRLAELYQVRARISADLHDELGLSLSRVALLAEMTRPGLEPGSRGEAALAEIASSARDLVDATSDMAWALDPAKDDLASLLARLGRLGGEVCERAGVEWQFAAPEELGQLELRDERRRHLYLILKEALHNAVRHGRPSRLALTLTVADHHLVAEVADDGCGFDREAASGDGGGLANMARRAGELGGSLAVTTRPGAGTMVRLELPLAGS